MGQLCRLGKAGVLALFCGCVGVNAEHAVSYSGPMIPPVVPSSPVTIDSAGPVRSSSPQVMADLSADLVRFYLEKPIERVKPFSNEVLGACVTGIGTTHAKSTAELVPCETQAAIDLIASGRTWTEAVSRKRPVALSTRGVVDFTVRTRVYFDHAGLRNEVPVAAARNQNDLLGICSDLARILDPIVIPAAKRQYYKKEDESRAISDGHAERRYIDETTADVEPEITKGNASFKARLAAVEKQNIRIDSLRMKSTATAITVAATIAEVALPGTPAPSYSTSGDVGVRIHEAMLDMLGKRELAGKSLTPEKIDARLEEITGKKRVVPKKREPFVLKFPKTNPVTFRFDKHRIEMVARLESFTSEDEEYDGVDVTIRYHLYKSPTHFVAVREAIEVYPTGFVPGAGKRLSARQLATAQVLKDRLAESLQEQISLEDLKPTGSFEKIGPLEVVSTGTQTGWLLIAWKRKTTGVTVEQSRTK